MEEIQLKDICDLDNGYAFKSDDYVDNSNTLNCRMSNIRPDGSFDILYSAKYLPDEFAEKYKDYILHDGDLIIAMTDMAGDPKILGVPTVVDTQGFCLLLNQRVGRLRFIRDGVNADYLKLALQCPKVRTYLKRFAGGGVQLNVSKKDILSAPVCMRNEEEQNHIAGLFKRVLEVKTKREQELQLLDDLIKARFVELFGDPSTNPKGYPVKVLPEIAEYWNGLTYKPEDVADEGTIVLRSSNIQNATLDFADTVRVSCKIGDKKFVQDNDILMCSRNGSARLVGKVALIKDIEEPMSFGAFMMIIRSDYYPYLMTYFQMPAFRAQITTGATTTINQITGRMLDNVKLPIPDMDVINEFADFVKQVDKSKAAVQKSLDETQQLFDSLMQQYFG